MAGLVRQCGKADVESSTGKPRHEENAANNAATLLNSARRAEAVRESPWKETSRRHQPKWSERRSEHQLESQVRHNLG